MILWSSSLREESTDAVARIHSQSIRSEARRRQLLEIGLEFQNELLRQLSLQIVCWWRNRWQWIEWEWLDGKWRFNADSMLTVLFTKRSIEICWQWATTRSEHRGMSNGISQLGVSLSLTVVGTIPIIVKSYLATILSSALPANRDKRLPKQNQWWVDSIFISFHH